MRYWLLKSEPDSYSIDHLWAEPGRTTFWDGVRNYQARNFIRDDMKKGDLAFFYHSGAPAPAIAGIVEITRDAYADPSAFEPGSKYFDSKSDPDNPTWFVVDVKAKKKFSEPITLAELRDVKGLDGMELLKRGSRLSVQPVSERHWKVINELRG
ncbi:MAG TPA: EVE domain-containing protein [Gemmatimonadales bacterium]|nr:EVE domain-containing protein [Gemmatimonadales bacterium]